MDWENETKAQFDARNELRRSDPHRYVELMSDIILKNPLDAKAYFARSQGFEGVEDYESALDDLGAAIDISPSYIRYLSRGEILSRLGRYREALQDLNAAETLAGDTKWVNCWGPLHQADCHSRLGNETEALAACARLKEDHWTPGLDGAPAGSKQEVIAEVCRRLGIK